MAKGDMVMPRARQGTGWEAVVLLLLLATATVIGLTLLSTVIRQITPTQPAPAVRPVASPAPVAPVKYNWDIRDERFMR